VRQPQIIANRLPRLDFVSLNKRLRLSAWLFSPDWLNFRRS
jgi:hypothetical protein